MFPKAQRWITAAALLGAAACGDRTATGPAVRASAEAAAPAPERLARSIAAALQNPVFRAYLKAQLDASPYAEHKVQLETFLAANGGRGARYVAEAALAHTAIPLEVYLPVPAHRAAWTGDEDVLVATAMTDRERPVAFSPAGDRLVLSAEEPPETPVIAVVPVETDFSRLPQRMTCVDCGSDGGGDDGSAGAGGSSGGTTATIPGLYMTKAHFVQDFEGWLKGAPEFEVHILGQKGQTDSLLSYQCAGEHQAAPYFFNQDNLDWSGSVMLFSKAQIDFYNGAHPGQNVRVFVVEDDDTACEIKSDPDRFKNLTKAVDSAFGMLTAGNDSSSLVRKIWGDAPVWYKLYQTLAAWLRSNDELVGNAVRDAIVGELHAGYNWIVKGENTVTNGWINLEMR